MSRKAPQRSVFATASRWHKPLGVPVNQATQGGFHKRRFASV